MSIDAGKEGVLRYHVYDMTSAWDAADVTVGTATGGACEVVSIMAVADAAQHADMDNIQVLLGASKVVELISSVDGDELNFAATDAQATWTGSAYLRDAATIVATMTSDGGSNASNMQIVMGYRPIVDGGHLV